MNKWIQKAIDNGTLEFKAYAEYVVESMPDVTAPVLREMFTYNTSVREYQEHMERIKRNARQI